MRWSLNLTKVYEESVEKTYGYAFIALFEVYKYQSV